jgi:hypothetical protein
MNDVLFSDPFYNVIIYYLPPKDLYNLNLTCKHYHQKITIQYIKRVATNLINSTLVKIFGDDFQSFKSEIQLLNAIISGDFVKNAILYGRCEGDLDIYCRINEDGIYPCELSKFFHSNWYFMSDYVDADTMKPYESYVEEFLRKSQMISLISVDITNMNDIPDIFKVKYQYKNSNENITIHFNKI